MGFAKIDEPQVTLSFLMMIDSGYDHLDFSFLGGAYNKRGEYDGCSRDH